MLWLHDMLKMAALNHSLASQLTAVSQGYRMLIWPVAQSGLLELHAAHVEVRWLKVLLVGTASLSLVCRPADTDLS